MKALIVVDMQNDFMPDGALGTKKADELIFLMNSLIDAFDLVVATKDWHPRNHMSFKERGGPWPVHCVQNTKGAEFVFGLKTEKFAEVFHKGTDPEIDSYSTFFDNEHQKQTGLDAFLKEKGVEEVVLAGLTTDYCVLYSALDAVELGYKVTVVIDVCRPIHDEAKAVKKMREKGVKIRELKEML
jgi:nicotinamidase/pyrazinamidase